MNDELEIIIIAAMSENRVIGRGNTMPWSVKGNLAHFKEKTMSWPCIMGRKTWESLPKKPLPGRLNIIVSKSLEQSYTGGKSTEDKKDDNSSLLNPSVKIFDSLLAALDFCVNYEKVFICGGESIYRQAMPMADKIDLTLIPGQYDGDAFFPEIDAATWTKTKTVNYDNFSVFT